VSAGVSQPPAHRRATGVSRNHHTASPLNGVSAIFASSVRDLRVWLLSPLATLCPGPWVSSFPLDIYSYYVRLSETGSFSIEYDPRPWPWPARIGGTAQPSLTNRDILSQNPRPKQGCLKTVILRATSSKSREIRISHCATSSVLREFFHTPSGKTHHPPCFPVSACTTSAPQCTPFHPPRAPLRKILEKTAPPGVPLRQIPGVFRRFHRPRGYWSLRHFVCVLLGRRNSSLNIRHSRPERARPTPPRHPPNSS
jgi:hypothetical protein